MLYICKIYNKKEWDMAYEKPNKGEMATRLEF